MHKTCQDHKEMLIITHLKCNKCSQRLYYDVYAADVRGNAAHTCYKKKSILQIKTKHSDIHLTLFFSTHAIQKPHQTQITRIPTDTTPNVRLLFLVKRGFPAPPVRACVRASGGRGSWTVQTITSPAGLAADGHNPHGRYGGLFFFITLTEV